MECGSDYYYSFENYEEALEYSRNLEGAKAPLALILKREYLDESSPGEYIHVRPKGSQSGRLNFWVDLREPMTPSQIS